VALPAFARHTPLQSAGRAAIDRYLLPAAPTAAILQLRVCCRGPMLRQSDRRTPCRYIDLLHRHILCGKCPQYTYVTAGNSVKSTNCDPKTDLIDEISTSEGNSFAGNTFSIKIEVFFHMSQLMPLPLTVSCFSKIKIGFNFVVSAHSG